MSDPNAIPAEMRRYLRDFIWRRRRVALLRRIGFAVSWALMWMLVIAVIDRIVPLPGWARLALLIALGAILLTLIFRPLRAILLRGFDWRAAAAQAEAADPRFLGRLETAVAQLLLDDELRGSSSLVHRIVAEANELASQGKARAVPIAPATRTLLLALLAAILAAVLCSISWLDFPTLLRRQWMPLAHIPAVTTTRISVDPGDVDVAQSGSCTIFARCTRLGSSTPVIRISSDDREMQTQPMRNVGRDLFSYTFASIDRDWQYDVSGGDARSEAYHIRVLRRPGVTQVRAHYVYPAYMHRAASTVVREDALLEAPMGTQATIELVCTEPVASVVLLFDDRRIIARATNEPTIYRASVGITRSGPYRVVLQSVRGVEGVDPPNMVIKAEPDLPPTAKWEDPQADFQANPSDIMTLRAHLADDYGITEAHLIAQLNQQPAQRSVLPLDGFSKTGEKSVVLKMSGWKVSPGDVLRLWVDALDGAGNESHSDIVRILITRTTVGPDEIACAAELDRAAKLSQVLAEEWGEALRASESPAAGFGRNAHLARCGSLAEQITGMVLRAIHANRSRASDAALTRLVDRAATCQSIARSAIASEESKNPAARLAAIARGDQLARFLRNQLRILSSSERARNIRTQLLNMQSLLDKIASMDVARAKSLRAVLQLAGRNLDEQITSIGIQPDDDELLDLLSQRIAPGDVLIESAHEIHWQAVVRTAAPAELSQRMLAASYAQALRRDPDLAFARDLNVAAHAIQRQPAPAMGALSRSLVDESARQSLRKLAADGPETSAFEMAAEHKTEVAAIPAIKHLLEEDAPLAAVDATIPATTQPALDPQNNYSEPLRLYFQMLQKSP